MGLQRKSGRQQTGSQTKATLKGTWHHARHNVQCPDFIRVLPVVTACICLLLIVSAVVTGMYTGKLSPSNVGTLKGVSATGSLIALTGVLYHIIRVALLSQPSLVPQRLKKDK